MIRAYHHIKRSQFGFSQLTSLWLLLSFAGFKGFTQPIYFDHISSREIPGMGNCWHTAIDKSGIFWISSTDGLLSYDGYNVQHYSMETHPEMESNVVSRITCDSKNRLWVATGKSPVMLDENRRLHKINIPGYKISESIDRGILEKPGGGYVAIAYDNCFSSPDGLNNWKKDDFITRALGNKGVSDIKPFDKESLLLTVRGKKIIVINFVQRKIVFEFPLNDVRSAVMINANEMLAGTESSWNLHRINIAQKSIIYSYPPAVPANNSAVNSGITYLHPASNTDIFIATQRNGLLRLDLNKESYQQYQHSIWNKSGVSSNLVRHITITNNGRLLMTSEGGIDYTNLNYPVFNTINHLVNSDGNPIRLNVNNVLPLPGDRYILGGISGIYEWKTGELQVKDFVNTAVMAPGEKIPNAYAAYQDETKNIWIGFEDAGIKVFNEAGRLIKDLDGSLPHRSIRCFAKGPGNNLLVGATTGLFMIDIKTFKIDSFPDRASLKPLTKKKRIVDMLSYGDNLWLAVSPAGAVYHYNWASDKLKTYDTSKGLISTRMYCLAVDKNENIYAGSLHGMSIIHKDGSVFNYTKNNGLPGNRIESIIADKDDNIWFTTTKKISKYVPAEKRFYVFDHRNGIKDVLFNVVSATNNNDGQIFFPTTSGFVHFDPTKTNYYTEPVNLHLTGSTDGVNYDHLQPDSMLVFDYDKGKITFQVTGSDAGNNSLLFYRFKMEGVDTGWSAPSRNRSIAYNLKPGSYRFLAEASYDLADFSGKANEVKILVKKPLWQKPWFLAAVVLLLILTGWLLYRRRIRTLKRKSIIEQQLAELEGKALRAQMNPHFIFNSLNAIQESVVSNNIDIAYNYLSKFSRLLRMVLNNSEKDLVSLSEEISMLKIYLQLEALRFKDSFNYEIKVDENIDAEMTMVPPLLLQPYIENAIWHGLMQKDGEKKLLIHCEEKNNVLRCSIVDNGIGRKRAAEIKAAKLGAERFESKGMKLSEQRINMMNLQLKNKYTVSIMDLYDESQQPAGTQVVLELPQSNNGA